MGSDPFFRFRGWQRVAQIASVLECGESNRELCGIERRAAVGVAIGEGEFASLHEPEFVAVVHDACTALERQRMPAACRYRSGVFCIR